MCRSQNRKKRMICCKDEDALIGIMESLEAFQEQ